MKNYTNNSEAPQGEGLFYGWIIVGSVFFMSATAAGIIYSFPAFVASFEAEFKTGRADISLVFAVSEFVWFMTGFAAGFVADRFGPRNVGLLGAVIMALGLAGASMATSLPLLYLAYGAGVGIGGGMIYVPAVGLVQRWFKVKRGLASGLAVSGTGVGTLLLPPLATALNETMGWRSAHLVLAGCALVVCGAASLLLVYHPRDMGLAPDGGPANPDASRTAPLPGLGLAEAVVQARFWLLYIASLLSAAGVFINYVHLVPYATDNGVSAQLGIILIGIMGICSTFGRFLLGGLADRFGRRTLLTYILAGLSLTMFWWLLAPPVFASLLLYATLFGILYGGYIALLPVLAMEYFGGHRIATIIGALYTSWGVGALFGPTMAGAIRDASGAYFYAILVGAISMAISALSCQMIREPDTSY
ncbi:MFS transporter [Roseibium sp.]|uniref:MFS transporter n=1 Tax=Roseibium sp. TaxID=1936156 RepID=UPI003A987B1C